MDSFAAVHLLEQMFTRYEVNRNNEDFSTSDETHHYTFYKSVVSGNLEKLEELIRTESLSDYRTNPVSAKTLSSILALVYEETKTANIQLLPAMECFIIRTVIETRFLTKKTKDVKEDMKMSMQDVTSRIEMMTELIENLINCYTQGDIDDMFVYMCRRIAKHMYILKYYLKRTYIKIPWEEMSFCLINFVATIVKPLETDDIYKLVLDRTRLMNHLKVFVKCIKNTEVTVKDINPKETPANRTVSSAAIKEANKEFEGLFHDYEIIKDVFSLRRIEYYANVVSEVNFEENQEIAKLTIERTLQIIGETLKSTAESPNVSAEVMQILLSAAPPRLIEIITSLRDTLSHADVLEKIFSIENESSAFFRELQKEIGELRKVINDALQKRKLCAFLVFMRKLNQCKNLDEVKDFYLSNVQIVKPENVDYNDLIFQTFEMIKNNLNLLSEAVENMTAQEQEAMKAMHKIIEDQRSMHLFALGPGNQVPTMNDYLQVVYYSNNLDFLRVMSTFASYISTCDSSNRKNFSECLSIFQKSVHARKNCGNTEFMDKLVYKISQDVMLLMGKMERIETFNMKLNEEKKIDRKQLIHDEIDELIKDICNYCQTAFANNSKIIFDADNFKKSYTHKKLICENKSKLLAALDKLKKGHPQENVCCNELCTTLNLKKQSEESFINNYKNGKYDSCRSIICSKTADSFGALFKCFADTNLFKYEKRSAAVTIFLKSFDLDKKVINEMIKYCSIKSKKRIKIHYNARLKMLKNILNSYNYKIESDIMEHFTKDKQFQAVTELLLLDLLNILEYASLLADDRLIIENYSPVLLGKSLRNYLAHGNNLIDRLEFEPSLAIIANALKFASDSDSLFDCENVLIGHKFTANYLNVNVTKYLFQQLRFFEAAQLGDAKDVEKCLREGSDIFSRNVYGSSVLYYPIFKDNLNTFKYIFHINADIVNSKDIYGHRPLFYVFASGSSSILEFYLENNLPLAICDRKDLTLLHAGAMFGHANIMKVLLKYFPKVDVHLENHVTPLHLASKIGHKDVVDILTEAGAGSQFENDECLPQLARLSIINGCNNAMNNLLEKGLDANIKCESDYTAIHLASMYGNEDIIRQLLSKGADINVRTNNGYTPLFLAVLFCQNKMVKVLLDLDADVNLHNKKKETPLYMAAVNDLTEIIGTLLDNSADIDAADEVGITPLHVASFRGNLNTACLLLKAGSKVNTQTTFNETSLILAAERGHVGIVELLLKYKADVNLNDNYNMTPLHKACLHDYLEIVNILLEHEGTLINPLNVGRMSPLHIAAQKGNDKIVKLLLEKGAHVNAVTIVGCNPLYLAVSHDHFEVADLLLSRNADPYIAPPGGLAPFQMACSQGNKKLVELLLKYVDVNKGTDDGATPLQSAVFAGHLDIVKILLANDAEIEFADINGFTPLLIAAVRGYLEIVDFLLKNGANLFAQTIFKDSIVHAAVCSQNEELLMLILEHLKAKNKLEYANMKNARGETPWIQSVQKKCHNISKALSAYGAGT